MISYHVCELCYEHIENKGEPVTRVLGMILQIFSLLQMPVGIKGKRQMLPIIKYLELNRYITTTEVPGNSVDMILAIPNGCQKIDDRCYFCFENHK